MVERNDGATMGCLMVLGVFLAAPFTIGHAWLGGTGEKAAFTRSQPLPEVLGALALGLLLWGLIIWFVVVMFSSDSTPPADYVQPSDRAAYDALRDRGYSDDEARDAAPSIRRLCEAANGRDCQ